MAINVLLLAQFKYMRKLILLSIVAALFACNEKTTLEPITANDLYPLQVGKTFFYRLDSTVLTNSSQSFVVKSYLAKDSIESKFIDGEGRPSFRIFRYLRDLAQTQSWRYAETYYASINKDKIEYVDNNLRFVALTTPATNGNQWNGTVYFNTSNTGLWYSFLSNSFSTYKYESVGEPFTVLKGIIPNTCTVMQANDSTNLPTYRTKNLGKEVYAVNVGLIYKELFHYEWQSTTNAYTDYSYGIKLNLIDYK